MTKIVGRLPGTRHFGSMQICGVCSGLDSFSAHGARIELVTKLVWRVKLVAELQPGVTTETEVARIERDADANLAELGLRLEEAKSDFYSCRP